MASPKALGVSRTWGLFRGIPAGWYIWKQTSACPRKMYSMHFITSPFIHSCTSGLCPMTQSLLNSTIVVLMNLHGYLIQPPPKAICFGDFFFLNIVPLEAFESKFSRLTMCLVAHLGRGWEVALHKKYKSQQFFFNLEKEIFVFWLQLRRCWFKRRLPCCPKLKFILFRKKACSIMSLMMRIYL